MRKIVLFAPGPLFKGGIANYNTSLAKAIDKLEGFEVTIISWTQQYPAIIPRDFIDRKSKKDQLEGTNISVEYITNYNNPFTWNKTVNRIREINPEMVIFQWSIAVQGIPLGYISKKLRKKTNIEVLFDMHFVVQKEGSVLDTKFTKRGIKHAHSYVVHSMKTARELIDLLPNTNFEIVDNGRSQASERKSIIKLYHPVYNMFEPNPDFDVEGLKKELKLNKHVFLFFGFIRKYKGLHNAIKAFAKALESRKDISLLVVGESFWNTLDNKKFSTKLKEMTFGVVKKLFLKKSDDERNYNPLALIDELGIKDYVSVYNDFVPNEDVHKYFQVSDSILLYYLTATPSGVESIANNFELPILATNVGHFPETITDGKNGYLAEADNIKDMANAMLKSIDKPIDGEEIAKVAAEMSWENYSKAILEK